MPDPIFITADDKRIRDLQTDTPLPLNWRLPFDFPGLPEAQYRTVQQLIDLAVQNSPLQEVFTGSTNPDNALGNDGDTYYKYIAGASFGIWYKINDSWGLVVQIPLLSKLTIVKAKTDIVDAGGGNWYMEYRIGASTSIDAGVMPYAITVAYNDGSKDIVKSVPASAWENNEDWDYPRIYSMPDPSTASTIIITIYAI